MKTADLITSYLNNEMNPEQERQFLLSVAASDSLRLSLKSHVMLDRIVTNQIQNAHVPESVRDEIFSQMSSSMEGTAPVGASAAGAEAAEGGSVFERMFHSTAWRFGRGAMVALLTVGGFAAGYLTRTELSPATSPTAVVAPASTAPTTTPTTGAPAATSSVETRPGTPAVPAPSPISQEIGGEDGASPVATASSAEATRTAGSREGRLSTGPRVTRATNGRNAGSEIGTHVAAPVGAGSTTSDAGKDNASNVTTAAPAKTEPSATPSRPVDTINRSGVSKASVNVKIKSPSQQKESPAPATNKGGSPDQ